MSTCYTNFASVYDAFMDNIPYEDWSTYLLSLLKDNDIRTGTLLELGCGTGSMIPYIHHAGYQVLGLDLSADMLEVASDKLAGLSDTTLLLQDMRDFDLDMCVDGIYCVCDGMNYLLCESDLLSTFIQVKKHLRKNGVFIFDLKTEFFYRDILGDQVFCDHQENCSYTWENSFFEEDSVNQYDLTIFVKSPDSDLYSKYEETHHQKAYDLDTVLSLLNQAGFTDIQAYDAFTKEPVHEESERIYIIVKKED